MTFEKQQCRVGGAAVECRRTSVSRLARNALNSSQAAKDTHNVYKSWRSTPTDGGTRARAWAPRAPRAAGWDCSPAPRSHLLHPVPRIASSSSALHRDSPERPLREGGGLRTPARVSQPPRAPLGGPGKHQKQRQGEHKPPPFGLIPLGAVGGAYDKGGATSAPAHFSGGDWGVSGHLLCCGAALHSGSHMAWGASGCRGLAKTRVSRRQRTGALQPEACSRKG